MEDYSNEVRERASQLYSENRVLGVLKKSNTLLGIVKDTENNYRVTYDLKENKGKCECKIGKNCEHILAVRMSFENGEFTDLDKIEDKLLKMNKRELSWVLLTLIEKFPYLSNYLAPLENVSQVVKRYVKVIMQSQSESDINAFADFLLNNKEKISKEDLYFILESLASCSNKCFYNFITEENLDANLMEALYLVFMEKGIDMNDIIRLEKIMEKDIYGNLDYFFIKLFNEENFRKKVDPRSYLKVLIRSKDYKRIREFLRNIQISNEEKFDILSLVDEEEALEFAKVNMLYSKLFEYYYNLGEYNTALQYLRKMIELKDLTGIKENINKISKLIKGENDLIRDLLTLAEENVILYPLLVNLYYNSSGSLRFDIANSIINRAPSLLDNFLDVIRIVAEQRKDKLTEILLLYMDKLVEKKDYKAVLEALNETKKYVKKEDFDKLVELIKEKYKRKRQLVDEVLNSLNIN